MNTFNPIEKRHHLSKVVADEIKKAILGRKYLPGAKLSSEQELCDQFNVSRTVIREALQTLSAQGLVRIEKGRGVFVEQFSSKTVSDPFYLFLELRSNPEYAYDVLRARQLIEPQVAGLAALNHKEEDKVNLEKNVDKLRFKVKEIEDLAQVDMEFHLLMAKASGNELMHLILEPIHRLMPRIKMAVMKTVDEALESAIKGHSKILKCVLERNENAAMEAMKEHLHYAEDHMKKMLAQNVSDDLKK